MKTYSHLHGDNSVVIPIRVTPETYAKLERLAEYCAKQQGTEVDDSDIPDLCEQAIEHALSQLDTRFREAITT